MTPLLQILITIIGSGALFSFIQFLITRHDTRKDKIDELVNQLKDCSSLQDERSKERYTALQSEIRDGLDERETTGRARYLEHREAIQKLNEAIFQLTKNDTEQSQYIKTIGESLIGLSHDKIIYLSDKILERGGITLKEKATLKSLYEPYQKLGGNGDCAVAFNAINDLPIITEEKAKEMDKEKNIIKEDNV